MPSAWLPNSSLASVVWAEGMMALMAKLESSLAGGTVKEPILLEKRVATPPARRRAGRRSKLTPAAQRRLLDAIRSGSYYEPACRVAGISFQTFRNWLMRGEREKSGPYFDFFEAVKAAEAEAELRAVTLWSKAMPKDWRAAKEFLERRHPSRWSQRGDDPTPKTTIAIWLQQIEERARTMKDPRGPRPGQTTIIDVIRQARQLPQCSEEPPDNAGG
jgi:hypothetical protein